VDVVYAADHELESTRDSCSKLTRGGRQSRLDSGRLALNGSRVGLGLDNGSGGVFYNNQRHSQLSLHIRPQMVESILTDDVDSVGVSAFGRSRPLSGSDSLRLGDLYPIDLCRGNTRRSRSVRLTMLRPSTLFDGLVEWQTTTKAFSVGDELGFFLGIKLGVNVVERSLLLFGGTTRVLDNSLGLRVSNRRSPLSLVLGGRVHHCLWG
jgi:hypothetical protein